MAIELTPEARGALDEKKAFLLRERAAERYHYATSGDSAIYYQHRRDHYIASLSWVEEDRQKIQHFMGPAIRRVIEKMDAFYLMNCTYQEVKEG